MGLVGLVDDQWGEDVVPFQGSHTYCLFGLPLFSKRWPSFLTAIQEETNVTRYQRWSRLQLIKSLPICGRFGTGRSVDRSQEVLAMLHFFRVKHVLCTNTTLVEPWPIPHTNFVVGGSCFCPGAPAEPAGKRAGCSCRRQREDLKRQHVVSWAHENLSEDRCQGFWKNVCRFFK